MPDVIDEAATIEGLYAALGRQDGDAMAAAYTADAVFEDPAFGELRGPQIGAMWRMLCSSGAGVEVEVRDIVIDGDRGSADWKATYVFGGTGRKVVNRIHAEYRFRDGLIVDHRDSFSFFTWSKQALGPVAWLIGWNPIGRATVRKKATARLGKFGG
ncbi:MAG: nuclear transport factor 2 family protein [Patulibacter sp.]